MIESTLSSALFQLFMEKGKEIVIPLSYRFFLHDPDHLWLIEEGQADLFAIQPRGLTTDFQEALYETLSKRNNLFLGDLVEGQLFFLIGLTANRIVFPFTLGTHIHPFKVLAKANTALKCRKLHFDEVLTLISQDASAKENFQRITQEWLEALSAFLLTRNVWQVNHYLAADETIALQAGETVMVPHHFYADGRLTLPELEVKTGALLLAGLPSIYLPASQIPYLLTPRLWLQSEGESKIEVHYLEDWATKRTFRQELFTFQELILKALASEIERTVEETSRDLKQKEHLDQQFLSHSLERLGKVLTTREHYGEFADPDKLFRAAQIVAHLKDENLIKPKESQAKTPEEHLYEIAVNSQVFYRMVTLRDTWWKQDSSSLVGFWDKRPVALISRLNKNYELIDPDTSLEPIEVDEEIAKEVAPNAGMFYRSFPSRKLSGLDIARFCSRGRARDVATIFIFGVIGAILSLFFPIANSILFNEVIPNIDSNLLAQLIGGMIAVMLSSISFSFIREVALVRLETLVDHDTEAALWGRLFDLPAKFFRRYTIGDLLVRVSAVGRIRKMVSGYALRIAFNGLFSLIYLGAMFYFSPSLTLAVLIPLALCPIIAVICFSFGLGLSRKVLDLSTIINSRVIQAIMGITKIRTHGVENRFFAAWAQAVAQQKKLNFKLGVLETILKLSLSLLPLMAMFIVLYLIMYWMHSSPGSFNLGYFFAFTAALSNFSAAISDFCLLLLQTLPAFPLWDRAKSILNEVPESDLEKIRPGILKGEVRMDQVSFRYDESSPYILQNISLYAAPGESIAIVGPTGCGKSSIVRLLLGFETPEQGAIYYDGKDLATVSLTEIRRQLGVVLQNSAILDGTIQDNITGGTLATNEQIMEAVRMAGFEEDLKQFPMGLRTYLAGGGVTLSGGQRQRLLIARALMGHVKVLIFDEATNALDNATQEIVTRNLDHLEVTRIIIAHRLSTIRNVERIYVLEHGQIVDQGTFQELSEREGLFRELLNKQNIL